MSKGERIRAQHKAEQAWMHVNATTTQSFDPNVATVGVTPDVNAQARWAEQHTTGPKHKVGNTATTRMGNIVNIAKTPLANQPLWTKTVAGLIIGATLAMPSSALAGQLLPSGDITAAPATTLSAITETFSGNFSQYASQNHAGSRLTFASETISPGQQQQHQGDQAVQAADQQNDTGNTVIPDSTDSIDLNTLSQQIMRGDWGWGDQRFNRLARHYDENIARLAQNYVNAIIWGQSPSANIVSVRRTTNDQQATQAQQATQSKPQEYRTRTWVVDKDGYWQVHTIEEPIWVTQKFDAVTETRVVPGGTQEINHPAVMGTRTVVDKEAFDELVETSPAHTIHHDAITETVTVIDKEAWDETVVDVPEHTVHHDAEYETVTVVDQEAWDEIVKLEDQIIHHDAEYETQTVIITPAWDEEVEVTPAHTVHHEAVTETRTVVDKPAWDETVTIKDAQTIHHPAQYETQEVEITPAWDETVIDEPEHTVHHEAEYQDVTVVDKEAWDEDIIIPAVTETVHHPAETKVVPVVVQEAWDEQVVDTPAWDEVIPAVTKVVHHDAVTHEEPTYEMRKTAVMRFPDGFKIATSEMRKLSSVEQFKLQMAHGGHWTVVEDWAQIQTGTHTVVDTPAWDETVVITPEQTIHHEATYKTVHHDAVIENRTIVVKDAWDETVVTQPERHETRHHEAITHVERQLVKEAYDEVIPAKTHIVHHDAVTEQRQVLVKDAWDEIIPAQTQIIHHDAVTHEETIEITPAWDEFVEAVTKLVHHEAVTEQRQVLVKEAWDETIPGGTTTIHHDAVTHTEQREIKAAYDEIIPATYKTVHHEAVTHEEVREIKAAWDEFVEAVTELVHHEAVTHEEEYEVTPAWTETVQLPDTVEVVIVTPERTERKQIGTKRVDKRVWVEPVGHWEYR